MEWGRQKLSLADFGPAVGIGWKTDRIVAAVIYNGYTGTNICMHVVSDGTRRWMTREYIHTCFHYPFIKLQCDRVTGIVEATNRTALEFDEHLGFSLETRLIGACRSGDLLILRMWRHECRFLKDSYGQARRTITA